MTNNSGVSLSFNSLISAYRKLQQELVTSIRSLSAHMSAATPGTFILLQFQMSKVTQMGESITNLISQVNTVISHAIQNQKTQ